MDIGSVAAVGPKSDVMERPAEAYFARSAVTARNRPDISGLAARAHSTAELEAQNK